MDEHDRAAIAVKEGMPIRKVAHDFARLLPHEGLVLTFLKRIADSLADVIGVGEQYRALPHEKMRRVSKPIFAGPGEDALEQRFVCLEHIGIAERAQAPKVIQSSVDACQKGIVLEPLNDGRIFGSGDVAQVAPRLEVTKGIKGHARLSRRYRACRRTA